MQIVIDKDAADVAIYDSRPINELIDFLLEHGAIIDLSNAENIMQHQYSIGAEMAKKGKVILAIDIESIVL
jgi:hypothetical protein